MSRDMHDRAATDWEKVVDAVRHAGGGPVAVPALDLSLIFHGYKQMQAERAAALALLSEWERKGIVLADDVTAMRHTLGELSEEAP